MSKYTPFAEGTIKQYVTQGDTKELEEIVLQYLTIGPILCNLRLNFQNLEKLDLSFNELKTINDDAFD
jgi:hypothetical protein